MISDSPTAMITSQKKSPYMLPSYLSANESETVIRSDDAIARVLFPEEATRNAHSPTGSRKSGTKNEVAIRMAFVRTYISTNVR